MRRILCVLAVAALVALAASAVVPPEGDTVLKNRPEWVQAPELGVQPSLDRVEHGDPRAGDFPGVTKFLAETPSAWDVTWDTRSNRVHIIQGPGVELFTTKSNRLDEVANAARAFMAGNPDLFGVDQADLVLDEEQSGTFGKDGHFTVVTFQQTYEGIPVEGATVFFRLNDGQLRSFGTERVADVHMSTRANVDKGEALQSVLDHAGFASSEVTELLNDGELKIVPTLPPGESAGHAYVGAPGLGYRHELVREVSFRVEGDDATYEALVDARSGRVLKLVDANDYATVKGAVVFNYGAADGPVMTFPSNVATTAGPCTALDGVNFRMYDNCLPGLVNVCDSNDAASFNGIVDLGSSAGHDCSTPIFGNAANTRSSRSGMYHLTSVRNIADTYHPANAWLDSKVTANMNINNTCNAYWNGSTVNFYRSGGGCGNTGEIPAVFLHEWGHGFDQNTGGAAPDRASGEAVGDIFAALYMQDPCIGPGFLSSACHNCTTCTGVRDLNDFSFYGTKVRATPANITNNGGINCDRWSCPYAGYAGVMGYEGHCEAVIAGAAVWNLTQDIGFAATEALWYPSMVPSKSYAQIVSGGQCNPGATVNGCGATNWYTVLVDLTTDCVVKGKIWDAFNAQGIACGSRPTCSTPCEVVYNPDGSVDLPPVGCEYMTPDDIHIFLSGLPDGTTVNVGASHKYFFCPGGTCSQPGGQLGGQIEWASSTLMLTFTDDFGWSRTVYVPVDFEVHTNQTFPEQTPIQTRMTELMGSFIPSGDEDFALIEIVAGTLSGFSGEGSTQITDIGGGMARVDSFFDLGGTMHIVGTSGGRFDKVDANFDFQTVVTTDPNNPVCGNNVREGAEVCDGTDLGGESCTSQGYCGGTLACNTTCSGFVTSSCTQQCGGVLANCVPDTGNSANTGEWLNFTLDVPAGATNLVCTTTGSNGDADLYVKFGSPPTSTSYDCRSWSSSSNETCNMGTPSTGTYHVGVYAYSTFTGLSVECCYGEGPCDYYDSLGGLSGSTGAWDYYTQDLAPCATTLTIRISGGSGDADLYVLQNANPTLTTYECRPYLWGNNETCTFAPPNTSSVYHIGLYGYATYSDVLLETEYH